MDVLWLDNVILIHVLLGYVSRSKTEKNSQVPDKVVNLFTFIGGKLKILSEMVLNL